MIKTTCDLCRRVKAQNETFKSNNGVDVCERCEAVIERFTEDKNDQSIPSRFRVVGSIAQEDHTLITIEQKGLRGEPSYTEMFKGDFLSHERDDYEILETPTSSVIKVKGIELPDEGEYLTLICGRMKEE